MLGMIFQMWQFIVVAVAGWLNRQQLDIVEYLREENRDLREQLKGRRIRFTDGWFAAVLPSGGLSGGVGAPEGADCSRVRTG